PADAIVVDTEAYDMILGNDWLEIIMTVIDIGKRKMRITWKRRNFEIPIDIEQGIRPKQIIEEDDLGEYNVVQILKEEQKIPQEVTKTLTLGMSLMSQKRREENKRKREEEEKFRSNNEEQKKPLQTSKDFNKEQNLN